MTYFAITWSTKKFQANLKVSGVLITDVTDRGNARLMLHIGQVIAITVKEYLNCSDITSIAIICRKNF